MSLMLTEHNRLATPVELVSMAPPAFTHTEILTQGFERPYDGTPEFVLDAREFAERHPSSPAALVQLAQAELAGGDDQAATLAATGALAALGRGHDDPIVFSVVQVLLASGSVDDAERALGRLQQNELRSVLQARVAIQRHDVDAAADLLDDLDSPEALATRGWIEIERARFDRAIALLRKALSSSGPTVPVLTNLGYAYAALGARDKAIRVTKQARALAPEDEIIGFNLVSFFVAEGDLDAARDELKHLRSQHPTRLRFDIAEADLFLYAKQPERALRVLRRARTSTLWAIAEPDELAELEANLAFVEWRLGITTASKAADAILTQLRRTEFRNLEIARLLVPLVRRRNEAERVSAALSEMLTRRQEDELLFLSSQLAFVRGEFRRASELAQRWTRSERFNASAFAMAVYLLTDVDADLDSAINLGKQGLRVAGANEQLLNNVAYSLALAGRLAEARKLLRTPHEDSVYLTATEGLVEILSGNVDHGIELYDRASALAQRDESDDPSLPMLAQLNKTMALFRAGVLRAAELKLPEGWEEDPHLAVFALSAEREGATYVRD